VNFLSDEERQTFFWKACKEIWISWLNRNALARVAVTRIILRRSVGRFVEFGKGGRDDFLMIDWACVWGDGCTLWSNE